VPVFNEQNSILDFYEQVSNNPFIEMNQVEIIFINDGSTDQSKNILENVSAKDSRIQLVHFSRNFGKEAALFCGLEYSSGDVVIPIDVDMQDPIELIEKMVDEWKKGAKVVLAKRIDRSSDHWLKRLSANLFYKLHNLVSESKIEENVGDFRLIDRSVVEVIIKLQEKNLFMKGILSWPGFEPTIVEYKRPKRNNGSSKFNALRLLNLAIEGITSFSTMPLKISTYIGLAISLSSLAYGTFIVFKTIIFGIDVPGYASLATLILFLGGVQLITIGVLGEYIGRIYIEVKGRPRYVVQSESDKQFVNKNESK
jgi:glycosyltransferase involved in cell wall biosynthesis